MWKTQIIFCNSHCQVNGGISILPKPYVDSWKSSTFAIDFGNSFEMNLCNQLAKFSPNNSNSSGVRNRSWNHPKELSCPSQHNHCACTYKLMKILLYIFILINNFKLYLITLLCMDNDTCYYLPYSFAQLQQNIAIKLDCLDFDLGTYSTLQNNH